MANEGRSGRAEASQALPPPRPYWLVWSRLRAGHQRTSAVDQQSQPPIESATDAAASRSPAAASAAVLYLVAFVTGGIVMSFEMLGSRYLNPYFGSGIYTWAALISTV